MDRQPYAYLDDHRHPAVGGHRFCPFLFTQHEYHHGVGGTEPIRTSIRTGSLDAGLRTDYQHECSDTPLYSLFREPPRGSSGGESLHYRHANWIPHLRPHRHPGYLSLIQPGKHEKPIKTPPCRYQISDPKYPQTGVTQFLFPAYLCTRILWYICLSEKYITHCSNDHTPCISRTAQYPFS